MISEMLKYAREGDIWREGELWNRMWSMWDGEVCERMWSMWEKEKYERECEVR